MNALLDVTQPGWRDVVVHQRFLPKMMVCAALLQPAAGGLAGRPGGGAAGADGVFLAGDRVGRRGLLAEASLASAREAARAAVRCELNTGHGRAPAARALGPVPGSVPGIVPAVIISATCDRRSFSAGRRCGHTWPAARYAGFPQPVRPGSW